MGFSVVDVCDAVRHAAEIGQAGGLRGQRPVPGRRAADRDVQRRRGRQRAGDLPGSRAVPRDRRHLLQPDAGARRRPDPHPRPDADRADAYRVGSRGVGHGRAHGDARRADHRRQRGAGAMLPDRPGRATGGQVQPGQLPRPLRPHRDGGQHRECRSRRGIRRIQGAPVPRLGAPRPARRRTAVTMSPVSAAVVALALLTVFGLLGFVWRAWLQHRRTGSTGFRGISGRIGSVEWVAGVGFVVALVVAVVGPALQLSGVITPLPVLNADWIQITGIALALLGIALTVWAQLDMGDSWRVGVDENETTALVHTGMFGWVRNPIYTAMLTFDLGIALLTQNFVTIAGLALAVTALELQVRRVEEPYLLGRHGAAYRSYTASVGRFIPGVGLLR